MSTQNNAPLDIWEATRWAVISRMPYMAHVLCNADVDFSSRAQYIEVGSPAKLYVNVSGLEAAGRRIAVEILKKSLMHIALQHPRQGEELLSSMADGDDESLFATRAKVALAADLVVNDVLWSDETSLMPVDSSPYRVFPWDRDRCMPLVLPQAVGLPPGRTLKQYFALLSDPDQPDVIRFLIASYTQSLQEMAKRWETENDSPWQMSDPSKGECDCDFGESSRTLEDALQRMRDEAGRFGIVDASHGRVVGEDIDVLRRGLDPFVTLRYLARTSRPAPGVGCTADYNRPRRRPDTIPNSDIIRPRMRKPLLDLAAIVDTSGSVRLDEVRKALSFLRRGLRRDVAIDTFLATSYVYHEVRIRSWRDLATLSNVLQSGGTDMASAMEFVAGRRGRRYSAMIVLTDGITPWPRTKPDIPSVVIGLVRGNVLTRRDKHQPPSWAHVVRLD